MHDGYGKLAEPRIAREDRKCEPPRRDCVSTCIVRTIELDTVVSRSHAQCATAPPIPIDRFVDDVRINDGRGID